MEILNKRAQLTHTKPTESNHGYHSELKVITAEGTKWLGDVYNDDLTHLESFLKAFDSLPDLLRMLELWNEAEEVKTLGDNITAYDQKIDEFRAFVSEVSNKIKNEQK